MKALAAALLVACVAAPLAAQQNTSWRLFTLPAGGDGQFTLSSSPPLREAYSPDLVETIDWFPSFHAELVADLVRELVEPGSWDADGHGLEVEDGRLLAVHRPEVLDRVGAFVAALSAGLDQRHVVEIHPLDAAPAARAAVLGPDEVDALIGAGRRGAATVVETRDGRPTSFGRSAIRQFVATWVVEIAEKSAIADPMVARLRTGFEGWVSVAPASRDRLHVTLRLREAALVAVDRVAVDTTTASDVELPTVDGLQYAGSAMIPDGGGFIVEARSGETGGAWLVRARRLGERRAPLPDVALLAAGGDDQGSAHLEAIFVGGSLHERELGLGPLEAREAPSLDRVMDLVTRMADPRWHDDPRKMLLPMPPFLVMRHPEPARIEAAREVLGELDDATSGPIAVELRLVPASGQGADAAVARFTFSLMNGRPAHAAVGRERAYVGDYQVEVAGKSSIAEAVPHIHFDGAVVGVVAVLGDDGRVALRTAGLARRGVPALEPITLRYGAVEAQLQRASWTDVRLEASAVLEAGAWTTLRRAGGPDGLVLEARVLR